MQDRRLKVWRCSSAAEDIVVRRVGRATTFPLPGHILAYCHDCYAARSYMEINKYKRSIIFMEKYKKTSIEGLSLQN